MISYKENKKRFLIFAVLVILVWAVGLVVLIQVFPAREDGFNHPIADAIKLQTSETGEFYLARDFDTGYSFSRIEIYAENISISNDKIGFFNSYVNRKILLKGLSVRLEAAGSQTVSSPKSAAIGLTSLTPSADSTMANLQLNFDTSNIFSLLIAGLDYKIVDEDNTELLSVVSNRASVQQRKPHILLEGNVAVSTDCGRLLQSNKILWDLSEHTFTAKGVYSLTEDGYRKTGKNIKIQYQGRCLDINIFNDLFGKGSVK